VLVYLLVTVLAFLYLSIPLALLGLAAGLLTGAGIGMARTAAALLDPRATLAPGHPDEAAMARMLGAPPDPAWLSYFAGQGLADLATAGRRCVANVAVMWIHTIRYFVGPKDVNNDEFRRWQVALFCWPVLPPVAATLVGVTVGAAATLLLVGAVLGLATATVAVSAMPVGAGVRARDRLVQWWRHASASCPRCYHVTRLPTFACLDTADAQGRVAEARDWHCDVRPGLRGVLWRRCRWGHRTPTGVLRAARRMTPRCPQCGQRLHPGAGTRRDVRVGVFGATSAGKTFFIMSAFAELVGGTPHRSTRVALVDNDTRRAYQDFEALLSGGGVPAKTAAQRPPQVVTALLRGRRHSSTVHLFDVAGEALADPGRHAGLAYFDQSQTLVFILDPFAIPNVRDRARTEAADVLDSACAAEDNPEDSYNSTALRLRQYGVRTSRQRLAFVVSKADLLRRLPVGRDLSTGSDAVRSWLCAQDLDNLVLSAERDFRTVRFFLSSVRLPAPESPLTPLMWLLAAERVLR
jgi:hypothetical protein